MKRAIKQLTPYLDREAHLLRLICKMRHASDRGWNRLAYALRNRILVRYACDISQRAQIGQGLALKHPVGVVIGDGVQIGNFVTIYQNVTIGRKTMDAAEYPTIGDHAVVYCGALIVGKITVGAHSVVQAHSIVNRDVPPYWIHCTDGTIKPLKA